MGIHKMPSGCGRRSSRSDSEQDRLRRPRRSLLFLWAFALLGTTASSAPRGFKTDGALRFEIGSRSFGPQNGDGPEENRDRFEPVLGVDSFLMRPSATKPVANSVEFMGQMVSYPQYIRLMRIQKEVINMDKVIRRMLDEYDSETLSNFEPRLALIAMYRQMRKMLPDGYVRTAGGDPFIVASRRAARGGKPSPR